MQGNEKSVRTERFTSENIEKVDSKMILNVPFVVGVLMANMMVTVISNTVLDKADMSVECQSIVWCGPCLSHAGCVFCRDEDYSGQERCGTRLVGTILMSSVFSHSNFSGNISLKTPLVNP